MSMGAITNLGDFPANATIYVPFSFRHPTTGGLVTISGFNAGSIMIYKNSSAVQRSSTGGYNLLDTDGIDVDGFTCLNGFYVDLSDDSDAGFYAAGNEYMVAVTGITVAGVSVNTWVATFSIERANGILALLKNGTYGLSALESLVDDLETRCTEARLAELDAANLAADVAAVKSDTAAILDDTGTSGVAITAAVDIGSINGSTPAATNLKKAALGIVSGAAIAGTLTTSQMTTDLTEATNDHYVERVVVWTSGVLAGQAATITAYTGSSKMLTYSITTDAPSAADTFVIV